MSSRLATLLAFALSLAAGRAAAQPVTAVPTAPQGVPTTGGAAGASTIGGGSAITPTAPAPTISVAPGFNPVTSAPSAPNAQNNAAVSGAVAAPIVPGAAVSPAQALVAPAGSSSRGAAPAPATPAAVDPASVPADAALGGPSSPARRLEQPAKPNSDARAARPAAGAALNGTARKISEARLAESAGGDLSVSRALDLAFDASAGKAALRGGVEGRAQDVRQAIAQKVGIANTASPADAPGLYQDAIKTAKEALPAPVADGVATVVRTFAARKADVSLGDLATAAFTAAAGGAAAETGRLMTAFDKWESLLGAPGKPLISNAAALKSGVTDLLQSASAGGARSAPHVWFAKTEGSYTAMLPGAGVSAVPALAAAFAISPAARAPDTALSDAYRAFAADPRAGTGAGLVYRARRTLGASVPAAFASASRYWLRAAFEALWQRLVSFFRGRAAYELSQKTGQDALRRDAAAAADARGEAAAARRLMSAQRLTVGGTRAAFAALARSAEAYRALTGEDSASAAVEGLRRAFESAAAARNLSAGDEVPPGLAELVTGPGAASHWAERLESEAARAVDSRFWSARSAAGFVNLGAENGIAAGAAAVAKDTAGAPLTLVALDERLWARGRGGNGEARLSADLRATTAGGSIELFVERGSPALARRLEDLGLTVARDGSGLRATEGSQDFSADAGELSLTATRALSAALGREEAPASSLRDLAAETRRDPASAARLAALLDGREAFARAPVIGLIGEYEALAPTSVSVNGRPLLVSALRDPDTGLLSYARAARPNGVPLDAAELRALLPRGK
jgi:hypothetical protein